MKQTYGKLKTVLLVFLSLVMVFSVAFASVGFAATTTATESTADSSSPIVVKQTDANSLGIWLNLDTFDKLVKSDLTNAGSALVSAIKSIASEQLNSAIDNAQTNSVAAVAAQSDDVSTIIGRYEDYLKSLISREGEIESYLNGDYDSLIKHAAAVYALNNGLTAEQVAQLVDEVTEIVVEVIAESAPSQASELVADVQRKAEILTEDLQAVVSDPYSYTLSAINLLSTIRSVKLDGHVVYNQSGIVESAAKALLKDLYHKVANMNGNYSLTYNVQVDAAIVDINLNITIGVTGEKATAYIGKAIAWIKDHVTVDGLDRDTIDVTIDIPDEFAALLLKLANTESIPVEVKQAVFGLLDKNIGEIWNVASDYSIEQIVEYIKSVDFNKVFSTLLDAELLKDFFGSYGTYLDKLPQARIEQLIDRVISLSARLAGKVADKATVKEIEALLQNYGIPGIPAELEGAVQRFLNLLNRYDIANIDRAQLVNFLKTGVDAKIDNLIDRVMGSSRISVAEYYATFCSYVDRAVAWIEKSYPQYSNTTIVSLFNDGAFAWSGNVSIDKFDYDNILTRAINRVLDVLNLDASVQNNATVGQLVSLFEKYAHFEGYVSLTVNVPDIYKVTFDSNAQHSVGLLPVGADLWTFANQQLGLDNKEIVAWLGDDGVVYSQGDAMPEHDVVLTAVTAFDVAIVDVQGLEENNGVWVKDYDGKVVTLVADVTTGEGHSINDLAYQWQLDGIDIAGATSDVLVIDGNATLDSGRYTVVVTSNIIEGLNASDEIEVAISKAVIEFVPEWDYEDDFVYDGYTKSISLKNELDERLEKIGDWSATKVGDYEAKIELKAAYADNYSYSATSLKWKIVNGQVEQPHVCQHVCPTCGKCTSDCTDPACADKCPGHGGENPPVVKPGVPGREFGAVYKGTSIIVIDVDGVVPTTNTLVVGDGTTKNKDLKSAAKDSLEKGKKAKNVLSLDISFSDWSGEGNFIVIMTNEKDFAKLDENTLIVHIHGNTTNVIKVKSAENGKIEFEVTNFSEFAVMRQAPNLWWLWVLIAVLVAIIIVLIILLVLRGGKDESEETVAGTTADATVAEVAEDEVETPVVLPVAPEGQRTILDRSFTARLSQADDDLKENYSELKNELLSYKKIRSRVSWKYDSFYKGRAKCVILQVRGKKLNMYIALKAEDLAPKYHAKDVSDKKRYENVPTLVKVKGPRSLKYAKQLIAQLMANMGVERGEQQKVNYKIRRRSTKALMRDELIKIKTIKSNFAFGKPAAESEPAVAATDAQSEVPVEATADGEGNK